MKKKKFLLTLLVLAMSFVMLFAVGCNKNNNSESSEPTSTTEQPAESDSGNESKEDPTYVSITLDKTEVSINAGETLNFETLGVNVVAKLSDNSEQKVKLTENMILPEDLAKLNEIGEYELTVTAFGKTTKLKVTVKALEFPTVTAEALNVVYDGNKKVPVLSGLLGNASYSWKYYLLEGEGVKTEVENAVNVGEYEAVATITLKNYKTIEVSTKITISPKQLLASDLWWENTVYMYNGKDISLNATAASLPAGVEFDRFEGSEDGDYKATAKEVGEYKALAFFKPNANYTFAVNGYEVSWTITSDYTRVNWISVNNGVLSSAVFAKKDDKSGTLAFDNYNVNYTVTTDASGLPTFTVPSEYGISFGINGDMLSVKTSDANYFFVSQDALLKYYSGEFSTLVDDFTVEFDFDNNTAKLLTTYGAEETQEFNITLTFEAGVKDVTKGKLLVEGEDYHFEYYYYSSSYYGTTETLKLFGYTNAANYDIEEDIQLAKKADVENYIANFVAGNFVDKEGNTLNVTNAETMKYNGVNLVLWAEDYYGAVRFNASINSNNGKDKEFKFENGYYTFSNAFFNESYLAYVGKYFLDNATAIDTKNTISFMEYASYDVRFSSAEAINGATSKTFTFGKTEGDVVTLKINEDGNLVATLTFKSGETMDMVFNADGTAKFNGNVYKKYDKLFPAGSLYSPKTYRSADGKEIKYVSSYSGNSFEINGQTYKIYDIYVENGVMTLTFTDGDGNETNVVYDGDERYVKVGEEYYLSDDVASKENGFDMSATFVNGDNELTFAKGVLKLNGTALTNLKYSFGKEGRKLLTVTGELDGKKYSVEFYSLASVKVAEGENTEVYINGNLSVFIGVELRYAADAKDKIFLVGNDGKVTYDGAEVYPSNVTSSKLMFSTPVGGKLYQMSFDIRADKMKMVYNDGITYNLNLVPTLFFLYDGLYKSYDDNGKLVDVLYFNADVICYNNTNTEGFTVQSMDEDSAVILIGGKKAQFLILKNGTARLEFEQKAYTRDETFDVDAFNGKYNGLTANGKSLEFEVAGIKNGTTVMLKKLVVVNGEIVPVFASSTSSWSSSNFYILKNTDAATSGEAKYIAVEDNAFKYLGKGYIKLNANDSSATEFNVSFYYDKVGKKATLSIKFGNEEAKMNNMAGYGWQVEFNGVVYYVQTDDSGYLKLYPYAYYSFENRESELFGNTIKLASQVKANGESVMILTFNGEEVNYTLSVKNDITILVFTANGVEYTAYASSSYSSTCYIRPLEEAEKEFFFEAETNAAGDAYQNTINGKVFEFMFDVAKSDAGTNELVFNLAKTKYDGKNVTVAKYFHEVKKLLFATADGSFEYDLVAKTLTNVNFGDNAKYAGVEASMKVGSGYYAPTATFKGVLALGSDGTPYVELSLTYGGTYSKVTEKLTGYTALENGDLKIDQTINGTQILAYIVKDAKGNYGMYSAEQYELAGEYAVSGKKLTITANFENGNVAYMIAYGTQEAVAVSPDFTNKKFVLKVDGKDLTFTWSVSDGVYSIVILPDNAKKFEITTSADYCDVDSTGPNMSYIKSSLFREVNENGKTVYNVTIGSNVYDGVLSDDETYITVTMNDTVYRFYKNAKTDDYYKYVAVKESSEAAKYLGEFTVDEDKLTIGLYGQSYEEYDEDDDEDYFAGCKAKYFVVTYKGTTVTVKYDAAVANGIEFKVGDKTYVAKLNGGAMTVNEKAAA